MFNLSDSSTRQELLSAFLSARYSEFDKPFSTYKSNATFLVDNGYAVLLREYKGPYTQSKIQLTPAGSDLFKLLELALDAGYEQGRDDSIDY